MAVAQRRRVGAGLTRTRWSRYVIASDPSGSGAASAYSGGAVPALSRRDQPSGRDPAARRCMATPSRRSPSRRCRSRRGAGKGGRPAEWCRRDIVDAIRYLVKRASSGGRCRSVSRPIRPAMTCWMPGRSPGRPRRCTASARPVPHLRPGGWRASWRLRSPSPMMRDRRPGQPVRPRRGTMISGRMRHIAVDTIRSVGQLSHHRPGAARPARQADAQPGQAFVDLLNLVQRLRRRARHLGEDKAQAQRRACRSSSAPSSTRSLGGALPRLLCR